MSNDDFFSITTHTIPATHARAHARALVDPLITPSLAIKCWTPTNSTPSRASPTFIFAGGLGVPKEVYTPFFHDLTTYLSSVHGINPRSFWMADPIYSSSSAILNATNLGNEHFAFDHSLDMLSMLSYFSSEMRPGPVIAVGECWGAMQLAWLAGTAPGAFDGMVCIDPNLHLGTGQGEVGNWLAWRFRRTMRKREVWESRAEAEDALRRNPFYKDMDQRYVELWCRWGFCDVRDAPSVEVGSDVRERLRGRGVATTTPRLQEVYQQVRPRLRGEPIERWGREGEGGDDFRPWLQSPHWEGMERLKNVRCRTLFVSCEKSNLSLPDGRKARLEMTGSAYSGSGGLRTGMVEEYEVKEAEHDAIFNSKHMKSVVNSTGDFIQKCLDDWKTKEEQLVEWRQISRAEQIVGDERITNGLTEWSWKKDIREIMKRKMKGQVKSKM